MTHEVTALSLADIFRSKTKVETDPAERREALNKASIVLSREFQKLLMQQATSINNQIPKAAKKYNVDPLYVNFNLVRPLRYWPQMASQLKDALMITQKILAETGAIPPFGTMQLPESQQEVNADAALIEMADWAHKRFIPRLRTQYYKAAERAAKPHIKTLRREGDPGLPIVDATSQVLGYLRHKIERGQETSPLRMLMLRALDAFKAR